MSSCPKNVLTSLVECGFWYWNYNTHTRTHRAINYIIQVLSIIPYVLHTFTLYSLFLYSPQADYFLFQHIIYFMNTVSSSNEVFFPSLTLFEKAVKQLLSGLVQCCHLLVVISCYSCTKLMTRRNLFVPSMIPCPHSKHHLTPQRIHSASFIHLSWL